MNLHSGVLLVHISAAVVLLANSLVSPFVRGSMRRAATVGELSGWLDFLRRTTRSPRPPRSGSSRSVARSRPASSGGASRQLRALSS